MTNTLSNKIAIVTGAATGVGKATAKLLAQRGASVVVADINAVDAKAVASDIVASGGRAIAVKVDVTSEDSVRSMVGEIVAEFGGVDILHNNAALQSPGQTAADRDVCNLDIEVWDRAMNVNARGALLCSKHVIPHMLARGGGALIHTASGMALQGDLSMTAYAASKGALITLSKYIAAQYGKQGIRSNVIALGLVQTETALAMTNAAIREILLDGHLTPYLGESSHIAEAVAFLASDAAAFITGATIPVDGGFTSHAPTYAAYRKYFDAGLVAKNS